MGKKAQNRLWSFEEAFLGAYAHATFSDKHVSSLFSCCFVFLIVQVFCLMTCKDHCLQCEEVLKWCRFFAEPHSNFYFGTI